MGASGVGPGAVGGSEGSIEGPVLGGKNPRREGCFPKQTAKSAGADGGLSLHYIYR